MADQRPNILWICTDQQRFDTIGALGNSHVRTPHIDALAAAGTAFTHAFCQSPICTPSRASFLTGMYPSSVHGCTNGNDYWADAAPLVTRLLAEGGYDCGLAGKLHLAGAHGRIEPRGDDGYRVFHWSHDPRDIWPQGHAYANWVHAQGGDLKHLNAHPEEMPVALHQTTWCTDRAIDFLSEERDGPWLMSVNMFDPHSPLDPPGEVLKGWDPATLPGPSFGQEDLEAHEKLGRVDGLGVPRRPDQKAKQDQAAYYAMIELIDDNVGRMLAALEQTGQRDNTLVIFMSDHGEMLWDHGLMGKGCRFYEPLVRVPLICSWPGQVRAGVRSAALVELIDIAPMLLQLAGVEAPSRMQGRSLWDLLTGQANDQAHRPYVRSEYYRALNPDAPGREHLQGTYGTMIRDQRYKLSVYHDRAQGELFDLQADPGEFDNLWDDPAHGEVRFRLLKASFDQLAQAVDIGPVQTTMF
ncbi:MAG: sulfatase-like hydrolase/transferase [Candidatus Latescibacteria bacterium]|nr:sulfatase-like hydrolase/transferase [Candidatus Latescibacterota bacterium]